MHLSLIRRLSLMTVALSAAACVAAGTSGFVIGCSSSDSEALADGKETNDGAARVTSPGSDAGISFPDAGTADEGDKDSGVNECASGGEKNGCMTCCNGKHAEGAKTQTTALLGCACKAEQCKTACDDSACASSPKPPDGGSACTTCIQSSMAPDGGCGPQVSAACTANADCKAFVACSMACEKLK